jgi:conjugal transfer/type IV secretion protein DotA/TraY
MRKQMTSLIRRFLSYSLRLDIAKSLQPFADFYFNFGRILTSVFVALKLIDRSHPWARCEASPRPLEVLSYACARVQWNKPWQPQAVLVGAITLLVGLGGFAATSMTLATIIGAGDAYAASMFTAPSPATDLALKYMSNGFGVPIDGVPVAAVDGVVEGFQKMMALYSTAMLIVAGFILFYIITSAIAATAHEGRFGGSSFNQIWAPIRLVVAIGLLVPMPMAAGFNGYNSGQYIVMKMAEFGSGLATNLWVPFATSLADSTKRVLVVPSAVPAGPSVRGLLINEFCRARYNAIASGLTSSSSPIPLMGEPVETNDTRSKTFYYTVEGSDTSRYCGATTYERAADTGTLATLTTTGTFSLVGNAILKDINSAFPAMKAEVRTLAEDMNNPSYIDLYSALPGTGNEVAIAAILTSRFRAIIENYQNAVATAISSANTSANTAAVDSLSADVKKAGWAGAPMWFNTIARMNAEVMGASRAVPSSSPPDYSVSSSAATSQTDFLVEKVKTGVDVLDRYLNSFVTSMAAAGYSANQGVTTVGGVQTSSVTAGFAPPGKIAGFIGSASAGFGVILDWVFSTSFGGPFGFIGSGVNTALSQINPLAELAAIGDWIINKSLLLITVAFGGPMVASLLPASKVGEISLGMSTFLFIIGAMGFGVGVTLFYMLPLLPFIRFLVAIAGWLLNILEAIIAIPLMAVAHLSTKGEGISGDMSRTGYFMIFSIFLRPALLIVGMITALMMFSLSIGILNDLYKTAVIGFRSGAGGEANGGLSTIMYTIIYCIAAYGLCNMCFKLIEEIPNRALTWINQQATREINQDESIYRSLGNHANNYIAVPLQNAGSGRVAAARKVRDDYQAKIAMEKALDTLTGNRS